jgi:cysteine desulfurase
MPKYIYLDYAAATPMDARVVKAMAPYWQDKFYNPSASYLASKSVREDLNEARSSIAKWLGARPAEIYFTAGATEANNLAINGIMQQFPKGEILVSQLEHDSVLEPAKKFNHFQITVNSKGAIDLTDIKKKINGQTALVSVMMVNNELGTIQPLSEIAKIIAEEKKGRLKKGNKMPLYFHTDAAQAGNLFDLHVSRLGVDMMSLNGGKIYGPKQTGALYVKAGIILQPLIVGGGQERNLRSGTENVAGAIGLAAALDLAQKEHQNESKRLQDLRKRFISKLLEYLPRTAVNGDSKHQSPHLIHVTFPGVDNERLMMELDEKAVQVAAGSACSASNSEPSHVLKALGMSDKEAHSSIRISMGRQTSWKDLSKTLKILKEVVNKS